MSNENTIIFVMTFKEAILLKKMLLSSRVDNDEEKLAYELIERFLLLLK